MKKKFIQTGKIVGTHGVRGEMRLQPWSDTPADICHLKRFYFENEQSIKVKLKPHGNMVILKAEGINDIPSAEAFRNRVVFAKREDLNIPDGHYLIEDLLGCKVYDVNSQKLYGVISDVSKTGANDVWHIKNEDEELLIPSIPQVVKEVNIDGEYVKILPLEGLFE